MTCELCILNYCVYKELLDSSASIRSTKCRDCFTETDFDLSSTLSSAECRHNLHTRVTYAHIHNQNDFIFYKTLLLNMCITHIQNVYIYTIIFVRMCF